jgi:hypothetical protein
MRYSAFLKNIIILSSTPTKGREQREVVESFLAQLFSAAQAVLVYMHGAFW